MNLTTNTTPQEERANKKLQALRDQVVATQAQLEQAQRELEAARAELAQKEVACQKSPGRKRTAKRRTTHRASKRSTNGGQRGMSRAKQQERDQVEARIFQLSQGHRSNDTYLYDLLVDGVLVLHDMLYQACYEYALQQMDDEDLYCEAAMEVPMAADELRKSHNAIETYCHSDDPSYTPKYSYGRRPFTSERR